MNAISSKSVTSIAIHNGEKLDVEAATFARSHQNMETIKEMVMELTPKN